MPEPPNDTVALAVHLDRLMRRIHADLRPKALKVDVHEVGPLGGMVLMTIEDCGQVSLQELARLLARDKGQTTRFVQMLERKALVSRVADREDRRVSRIGLTDSGRSLVEAFRAALTEVVEAMLVDVGADERRRFLETLHKLLQARADTNRKGSRPDSVPCESSR